MTEKPDYRATVFLPITDFPMKAGLAEAEPKWLAHWAATDVYGQLRKARKGAEKFILHDGPPYANGDIHIGHALNKTLKDVVVRTQSMLGKDSPYVPGWDCHGLPIEWKIEEQYRKKKLNKDEVDPVEFRQECRDFAAKWVGVQTAQFQRLGIWGDWQNPYLTMNYESEAVIVGELLKFAANGSLYRGAKPVMWSPVEKTALAEAEIEYEDVTSTQIDVAFEIVSSPIEELVGAYAVIWTTTPWTIPVNQAIAYGEEEYYRPVALHRSNGIAIEGAPFCTVIVAEKLLTSFRERISPARNGGVGIVTGGDREPFLGSQLAGTKVRHPFAKPLPSPLAGEGARLGEPLGANLVAAGEGASPAAHPSPSAASAAPPSPARGEGKGFFDEDRPMLPGDFVTTDQGTGLVHMAPDHGEDDFYLCKQHGINPVFVVQPDGSYRADWPVVGGNHVYKVNAVDGPVCTALGSHLLAASTFQHSYPHSWRSKAKLIYRCTPQWFVSMDKNNLRQTALTAISNTKWVPPKGENRIRAMVEGRPDWVLSRQRAWGVPIALFVDKASGAILNDDAINQRIIAAVEADGADAWYTRPPTEFMPSFDTEKHDQVFDILDVWFDSGSTHAFVLEQRDALKREAGTKIMYLEGSDQHRGWFQSSLLESCGTRGRAPYDVVMTHGFTLDGKGMKMSKSLGNTIDPLAVIKDNGADILRLWAVSVDYFEDNRISKDILTGCVDSYRKLRNTLRYLLGALHGFSDVEIIEHKDMPALEQWVLHRVAEVDAIVRTSAETFDFNTLFTTVYQFCIQDLSALYFDIRKDSLYCDAATSMRRRAARTVMAILFDCLVKWLAPVLVFTCEEAWAARHGEGGSVHLQTWQSIPPAWGNPEINAIWSFIRIERARITAALEMDRRDKRIGSSLESSVTLILPRNYYTITIETAPAIGFAEMLSTYGIDMAEVCITSEFILAEGDEDVVTTIAPGHKCARCWRILPEVNARELCLRCDAVVGS